MVSTPTSAFSVLAPACSARCQTHHYEAGMGAREDSFSATCSTRAREPRELGTAIHAPFNELQSVHMSFYWTITVWQYQSCKHSRLVLLDPFGK